MDNLDNPKLINKENIYENSISLSEKIKNLSKQCLNLRKDIKYRNDVILHETKIKFNERYLRDYISITDKLIDKLVELESKRTFLINYYIDYTNNILKYLNVDEL